MATLVSVTIGPVGCTYRSLYEFEALNLNLVALDQYYEVTFEDECWHQSAVIFSGWTTDATRYLHFIGKNGPANHKPRISDHGYGMATLCSVNANFGTGANIDVSSIGAGGYIIFENLAFYNTIGNSGYGIRCSQNSAVTLDFRRCIIDTGTDTSTTDYGIYITGNNANNLKMHNCIINSSGGGIARTVTPTIELYNCTIYSRANNGVDFNNNASSVIKNCYVHAGTACLVNITGVTITTTATSDATGSVGLQNILFDHTNFKSIAKKYGSRELMTGSSLIAAGTSVVGQPAPFDYTTDYLGKSIAVATPDIGALMYDATESPRVIERHLKASNGDYVSMSALSTANRDLVSNNEQWIIHCDLFTDSAANADFNGWVTDSTRYLHIKARNLDGGLRCESISGHTTPGYYFARSSSGLNALTITDIGTNGLIIFEGIAITNSSTGANSKSTVIATSSATTTIRFKRCQLNGGNSNPVCLYTTVGSLGLIEMFSCCSYGGAGLTTGTCIDNDGSTIIKAYQCSFIANTNGACAVNMGDVAGCELVNCYATYGAGLSPGAYTGLTNVTMISCASEDATGSVGHQNVAYDDTTFFNVVSSTQLPFLRLGSPLFGSGAPLISYSAPYNVTYDINNNVRPLPPSIGCCDLPSPTCLGWTAKTGIGGGNASAVTSVAVDPATNALYCATLHAFGKVGEIFSLADLSAAYNLEYTAAVSDSSKGMVTHTDGFTYAIIGDALHVVKSGAPWAEIAGNYLGGTPGNPAYGHSFISGSDGYLYCGHANGSNVHKDTDGVGPWTLEANYPRGSASISGGSALWEHPDTHVLYRVSSYGMLNNNAGGTWGEMCILPDATTSTNSVFMCDGTYVYLVIECIALYGTSWLVYRAPRATMKFKIVGITPGRAAAPNGAAMAIHEQLYVFGLTPLTNRYAFYYSTNQGESWSLSPGPAGTVGSIYQCGLTLQPGIMWGERGVFGSTVTTGVTAGVWYSDLYEAKDNSKFFMVL